MQNHVVCLTALKTQLVLNSWSQWERQLEVGIQAEIRTPVCATNQLSAMFLSKAILRKMQTTP